LRSRLLSKARSAAYRKAVSSNRPLSKEGFELGEMGTYYGYYGFTIPYNS
jgi:hypothetical protein